MKKIFTATACFLISIMTHAQNTGIGSTTPRAKLDVAAANPAVPTNNDGILIPRISVFPATVPTVNQNGMMVFLTSTSGTNLPGFYYWDNATVSWKGVSANTAWGLKGNEGISAANNFIGTTDNVDLIFKRDDRRAGYIGTINTSFGRDALNPLSTGFWNTATGAEALFSNTDGRENTANGYHALRQNTIGIRNSANGYRSLYTNTTGNNNTATGANTLFSNIQGSENTANGVSALQSNIDGKYNTANGFVTLYFNTSGNNNTATGHYSLYENTTGFSNTATGASALLSNTVGDKNTANGDSSLFKNTTGNNNTANGYQSLYNNTSGIFNAVNGERALYSNTTGSFNTATGIQSLFLNTTASFNTATGSGALYNATGGSNTAVGVDAIRNVTTGVNNIGIGWNAQVPNPAGNDQIRIGNTNITYAGVQVAWMITSDSRFKSDIQTSDLGLDFIKQLRPVSYYRNNDESKKTEYGFIAQELEESLIKAGVTNNGIINKDDAGMYSVRYNDLIAPMVKATQELNDKVERLLQQNELQQQTIDQLIKKLESLEKKK